MYGDAGVVADGVNFSNFGSLKSTETDGLRSEYGLEYDFSNFGSLKSTETGAFVTLLLSDPNFSNFGSLKSTETPSLCVARGRR